MSNFSFRTLVTELCVSVSQTAVFFLVAVFSSNFLRDKSALTSYAAKKINDTTILEIGFMLLAILAVSGLLYGILEASFRNKHVNEVARAVLLELPRTISFFGSMIFATLVAVSIHLYNFPEPEATVTYGGFAAIGALFWLAAFVYAYFLKWAFSRRESETIVS